MNNPICPYIYIKKSEIGFAITVLYVDDLNLVGNFEELTRTTKYLKNKFEMKDIGRTKFCPNLQIKHFPIKVLVHQSTYIKKILKHFYIDKAHPLSSLMIVRSLDVKNDSFRSYEKCKQLFDPEASYLNALSAFMYVGNCICPNIAFFLSIY